MEALGFSRSLLPFWGPHKIYDPACRGDAVEVALREEDQTCSGRYENSSTVLGCVLGYRDALHATPGGFDSHTVHMESVASVTLPGIDALIDQMRGYRVTPTRRASAGASVRAVGEFFLLLILDVSACLTGMRNTFDGVVIRDDLPLQKE